MWKLQAAGLLTLVLPHCVCRGLHSSALPKLDSCFSCAFEFCPPLQASMPHEPHTVPFPEVQSYPAGVIPPPLIRTQQYSKSLGSVYNPPSCRDYSKLALGVMCLFSQDNDRVLALVFFLLFFCFSSVLPKGAYCLLLSYNESLLPKLGLVLLSCSIHVNSFESSEPHYLNNSSVVLFFSFSTKKY